MKKEFIHKEFLENAYTHQDFIPAYNFFKSNEDIRFMLKNRISINEVEELNLYHNFSKINEWFSKEINSSGYNNILRENAKITELEYKIIGLNGIKNFFGDKDVVLKDYFNADNYAKLTGLFHKLNLPIRTTSKLMVETIERAIKGIQTEISIQKEEMQSEKSDEKYNYIKEVAMISNILKTNIDPLTITLSLFVEQLKIAKDVARN